MQRRSYFFDSRYVAIVALCFAYLLMPLVPAAHGQSIKLAWDPNSSSTVIGYNVYRSQQSGVFSATPVNGTNLVTTAAYTDAAVQSGNTYYYVVTAVDGNGAQSTYSNQVQAAAPALVTNNAPVVTVGPSIKVAWDPSSSSTVIGYNIYRSQQSGVFSATPINGTNLIPTAAYTDAAVQSGNTYYYVVTAVDGNGAQSTYSNQVQATASVLVTNKAPVVTLGPNQTITLPSTATLTSSATDDGLPSGSLSYRWSIVSGNGVTLYSSNLPSTQVSFAAAGTYTFRMTVSDSVLSTSADVTVTVQAANKAPVLTTGTNQTVTLPSVATLTSSATDDGLPNGTLNYRWSVVSGNGATISSPTAPTTQVSFAAAGTYIFRMTVSDSQLSTSADVTVTAQAGNKPPAVTTGPNQTVILPNLASLTSSATDDGLPVGTLTYAWSVVSGNGATITSPTTASTHVSFSAAGTYILRVTVSDSQLSTSADVTVTVQAANKAPVLTTGPNQTITLPSTVTLTSSATDDGLPNGTLTYRWSVVSGNGATISSPTTPSTQVSFAAAGTYTLRMTASDSQLSTSADVIVSVQPAVITTNHAPTVNAGADQTIMLPASATLTANALDDGLPTGSTLTYSWSVVSGSGVTLNKSTSGTTSASFASGGTYTFRVTVSDGQLSSSDDVTVVVQNSASLTLLISKTGQVLKGSSTSISEYSNDPQVSRVELYIDGAQVANVNSSSLSYKWDLRRLSGTHNVSGKAYSSSNLVLATASETVYVK